MQDTARRTAGTAAGYLVVALVSAALGAWAMSAALEPRISRLERKAAEPVVLTESTVVRHTWRGPDGTPLLDGPAGTYEQPLWQYNDSSKQISRLQVRVDDLSAVLLAVLTDEEKRAILLRHDFTERQLDALASHFSDSP